MRMVRAKISVARARNMTLIAAEVPTPRTITKPGLYQDFPEADYHADPCPEPSASRSIVKMLVETTPRHAFVAHPRLTPPEPDDKPEVFDLGTALHTALLKRGRNIIEAQFADWKTKDSKEFRAAARAQGLVPILTHQLQRVVDAVGAVTEQLPEHGLEHLFHEDHGRAEVVGAWQDPVGGWCRFMADWLTKDVVPWDIKGTEVRPFNLETLGRHSSGMGYEWQHAFYERGIEHLYPELRGRVVFNFLYIELKAPFAILPVRLPNDAIAKGRALVEVGLRRWATCKASGEWPRYTTEGEPATLDYPPWATAEFAQ